VLASLLPNVFHHLPGADFTAIDIAPGIDRDALGRAGPFHFERIGNAVQHPAAFQAANSNSSFPAWVDREGKSVGFGVSHIDHVVSYGNAAGTAELLPFGDKGAFLIEN